jgi:uncharacterized membrane protein
MRKTALLLQEDMMTRSVRLRRSALKAVTYRILIMCLDFITIYLFTGAIRVALGFMIASNIYTTIGYFVHERIWARIQWGIDQT